MIAKPTGPLALLSDCGLRVQQPRPTGPTGPDRTTRARLLLRDRAGPGPGPCCPVSFWMGPRFPRADGRRTGVPSVRSSRDTRPVTRRDGTGGNGVTVCTLPWLVGAPGAWPSAALWRSRVSSYEPRGGRSSGGPPKYPSQPGVYGPPRRRTYRRFTTDRWFGRVGG